MVLGAGTRDQKPSLTGSDDVIDRCADMPALRIRVATIQPSKIGRSTHWKIWRAGEDETGHHYVIVGAI
jgi:hypothetical protein